MNVFIGTINVGFLLLIAYQVWKGDDSGTRIFFWPALIAKLTAGVCLGLVYTYFYTTGDTFSFFQDGVMLADLARTDLQHYLRFLWSGDESFPIWSRLNLVQHRALFMVKVASVFNLFTHDNYWVTSLYFSFASFISAWLLVKQIVRINGNLRYAAVVGFLFLPSAVFWSSGLIKETIAMSALFFLTYIFLKTWMKDRLHWGEWILLPLAIWLLWSLKYYYLAVFLPVAFASLSVHFFTGRLLKSTIFKVVVWCFAFIVPIVAVSTLRPNFHPELFLSVITSNYEAFHAISDPDDLIYYTSLEANVGSILRNAPWALFSGLFRPQPWEALSLLKVFGSIENFTLLILSVTALVNVKGMLRARQRVLLFSLIVYISVLSVFLALSTPNLGTLSRYRVGFLPFFFLLISIENPLLNRVCRFLQRSSDHLVR